MAGRGILDRILVALDGSKESEAVAPHVEELASRLKAELALVQVVAPDYHIYGAGGPEYGVYADQQMDAIKAYARGYLEETGSRLRQAGIAVRCIVGTGTAADEIIRIADEISADLVAMSTHGRSGVGRWALGSVAERVVRSGNTPVLLVRTPGAARE
jgi:nucleotide-binding universal stress UspA family protein